MKSKILVFFVIIIVIAVAVFAYNDSKQVTNTDQNMNASSTNSVQGTSDVNGQNPMATSTGKKMAFADFLKQNTSSFVCTVTESMSDFPNKGTIYIDGAADQTKVRMNGEFETVAEGKSVKSYVIIKDGFSYGWSSMVPNQGVKIKLKPNNADPKNPTYDWNADQVGDYDCKPWTIDEAKFALPQNVAFIAVDQK